MKRLKIYHPSYIHRKNKLLFSYLDKDLTLKAFTSHVNQFKSQAISDEYYIQRFDEWRSKISSDSEKISMSLEEIWDSYPIFSFLRNVLRLQMYHPHEKRFYSTPRFILDTLFSPKDVFEVNLENYYQIQTKDGTNAYIRFTDCIYVREKSIINQIQDSETKLCHSEMLPFMTQLAPRKLWGLNRDTVVEKDLKKVWVEVYDKEVTNTFFQLGFEEPPHPDLCFAFGQDDTNFILVKTF